MREKALWTFAAIAAGYTLAITVPNSLLSVPTQAGQAVAGILPVFVIAVFAGVHRFGLDRLCGIAYSRDAILPIRKDTFPYFVVLLVPLGNILCSFGSGSAAWSTVTPAAISVLICGAIIEELLFRGLLLGALIGVWRSLVAVSVTAVVFAALHLFNPESGGSVHGIAQFVIACSVGLALGLIRLSFDSLWPCVIVHILVNITSVGAILHEDGALWLISAMAIIAGAVSFLWWRDRFRSEDIRGCSL